MNCFDCYLKLTESESACNDEKPLDYAHICELQQQNGNLTALEENILDLDDNVDCIVCYKKDPTNDNQKMSYHNQCLCILRNDFPE